MADWIFDEDITKGAVDMFLAAGIKGKHLVYDYGISGKGDSEVIQIAKKKKQTLITANPEDFRQMDNVKLLNTTGVWILKSQDPDKQVDKVVKTLEITQLKNRALRKEKKVYITEDQVEVTDCRG